MKFARAVAVACLLVGSASAQSGSDNAVPGGSDGTGPSDQNQPVQNPANEAQGSSAASPQTVPAAAGPSAGAAVAAGPTAAVVATAHPAMSWGEQVAIYDKTGWPPLAPPFAPGTTMPSPPPPGVPAIPAPHGPPAPPPTDLSFFVIGDWGGQDDWPMTTVAQTQCATAMAKIAGMEKPQFIISTGDNFYESGIQGAVARLPTSSSRVSVLVRTLRVVPLSDEVAPQARRSRTLHSPDFRSRGAMYPILSSGATLAA